MDHPHYGLYTCACAICFLRLRARLPPEAAGVELFGVEPSAEAILQERLGGLPRALVRRLWPVGGANDGGL